MPETTPPVAQFPDTAAFHPGHLRLRLLSLVSGLLQIVAELFHLIAQLTDFGVGLLVRGLRLLGLVPDVR